MTSCAREGSMYTQVVLAYTSYPHEEEVSVFVYSCCYKSSNRGREKFAASVAAS